MKYDELLFERYFEDWANLSAEKIMSLLAVKSKTVLPSLKDIDFSKKLRVKLGIDPTGSDIHIGHICPIIVLNVFLKCGHQIDFIIGDFTAKIGDPSGRNTERTIISDEAIEKNFATYKQQISKYIDISKLNIHKNSTWNDKITHREACWIMQNINLSSMFQRDDFRNRISNGGTVTAAEGYYASLMGIDSVQLKTDVEVGGIDQLLNFGQCRDIQKLYGQKPETAITTPILEGTDGTGRKMSKSFGNYIPVNASAEDKFGKLMSIPDSLIVQYYKSFGYLYENEIAELEKFIKNEPMEAKKQLAAYFVAIEAKNMEAGRQERIKFETKFSKKELSANDFIVIKVKHGTALLDALLQSGKFTSKSELKRLLAGNGIHCITGDINRTIGSDFPILENIRIKCGKLNFFNLEVIK